MGVPGNWMKSLIRHKESENNSNERESGGSRRKWKVWRSSKGPKVSDGSVVSVADAFSVAMATVVRAAPKDFKVVRQEWAAIRIQTAFRGFLARRALRALKAVVRIQAIFRGQQVRKQADVTFRCMQSLVRVQALVRAQRLQMPTEGHVAQMMLDSRCNISDEQKEAEAGWIDSQGTIEEFRAKMQMRRDGAIKRERAIAYTQSKQSQRSTPVSKLSASSPMNHRKADKSNNWGWRWLERWMSPKPWDPTLPEKGQKCSTPELQTTKNYKNFNQIRPSTPEASSENVTKNNLSTRVSIKSPFGSIPNHGRGRSKSTSSASPDIWYAGSPAASCSSLKTSTTLSKRTPLTPWNGIEKERSGLGRRRYMNLTESIKAKQRRSSGEVLLYKKNFFSHGDSSSSKVDYFDPSLLDSSRDQKGFTRVIETENHHNRDASWLMSTQ